jgi:hypothetical protein
MITERVPAAALEDLLDGPGAGIQLPVTATRWAMSGLDKAEIDDDRAGHALRRGEVSSRTVPLSRSSTIRSGTYTSAFAPIGK